MSEESRDTPERVQPSPDEVQPQENDQPNNMEVHHPHHSHGHKKKWKDYVYEFLMLFLAVTAGFFVENQREHYIERRRSEQYAAFLYNDLKRDTVNLKERTEFMATGINKLDTLISLLKSFRNDDSTVLRIYQLSGYTYSGAFFSATTSTMDQLKNSGSLRYFGNIDLILAFSRYDTDLQRLKAVEERNVYLNEETRKFMAGFLDVKSISRFTVNFSSDTSGFELTEPVGITPPKFHTDDDRQFQEYANLCALKQLDWDTRVKLQTRLLLSARELMNVLKKEYGLK